MSFSFPYQLATPLILFALYAGILVNKAESLTSLKIIRFNFNQTVFKILSLLLLLVVGFLYADWTHKSNNLYQFEYDINNTWRQEKPFDLNIKSTVNYLTMPYLLDKVGDNLHKSKLYKTSTRFDEKILADSPNNIFTLHRFVITLIKLKDYSRAEKYAKKLQNILPKGLYYGDIKLSEIYDKTNQPLLSKQIYNKLKQVPEKFLKIDIKSYLYLAIKAEKLKLEQERIKFTLLYKKYHKK